MARKVNVTELKSLARGRWLEIFKTIAGIDLDPSCQKRHGPCPKCGGIDRFRATDLDAGSLYCNQCFSTKNGDGIAALGWLTGKDFKTTVATLCEYLGAKPTHKSNGKPEKAKIFCTSQGIVRYFIESLVRSHGVGVRLVKSWQYDTFFVLRFDLPTPPGEKQKKEFRPVHKVLIGLDGIEAWQPGYPAGPRPLYRRKELEEATAELVTIHGGEKAADAAASIGLIATTNAGGEKAMEHTDWTPTLRFNQVAVVVDNDAAGDAFGHIMAAKIRRFKAGADVRIIRLPGLPPKGDIVEWITSGGTKEQFLKILSETPSYIPVEMDADLDDDDPHRLAKVFLEEHCKYEKIVYWHGEYLSWDICYRTYRKEDLRADVTQAIRKEFDRINIERQLRKEAAKKSGENEEDEPTKARKVSVRIVSDVIQALNSCIKLSGHIEQQTWIDGTNRPNCIALQNCLLDLDAFIAMRDDWNLPHTPNWFSLIHLPYAVDITCKNVASPKFDAFMQRVHRGNPENILTLQEWMGYCLTHDVSKQKFLFLEGNGGNGKSVFCAIMIALLGRRNVSHTPLERFGNEFSLVNTLGKLSNIATECGELDKASEGFLKSFTDGSPMQFRQLYQQAFDARPTARLILCANNRPRFSDRSGALWRRMIVVPFNETISEEERVDGMDNPDWWVKSGELPGIFWWAVLGLHRLRQNGRFTISEESKQAVEEYRTETNPARSFLLDCCEGGDGDPAKSVECSVLYDAYFRFCKGRGYHPLGEATFGREVSRTFQNIQRRRLGPRGSRKYTYQGICLSEQNDLDTRDTFSNF